MVQTHPQQSDPAATYPLDQMGTAAQHLSAPGKLGTVAVRTIPPNNEIIEGTTEIACAISTYFGDISHGAALSATRGKTTTHFTGIRHIG
jgi:hypothetical protein